MPAIADKVGLPDHAYAVRLVHSICCLAGKTSYLEDLWADLRAENIGSVIVNHDTPRLFDWLMTSLSYQGIADRIAESFIERHGNVQWSDIAQALTQSPSCAKLTGYWTFHSCRYRKSSGACAEPDHFPSCPLPRHPLRNGQLNQMAYSLFLFIRDIANGDLVTWIDEQLAAVSSRSTAPDLWAARDALMAPLRNVYGVSNKVLAMALSSLLLAAGKRRRRWFEVGSSFVVVDTLVHNFLHRTGILERFEAEHPYGLACYRPGGCSDIVYSIADGIDARSFNRSFPKTFPRFIQHAIWAYCAENGLGVCNGNRIHDTDRCDNVYCQVRGRCDRVALKPLNAENSAS